ncbi:hypothetical protein Mp_5g16070 [Marchantia polymorpha subsp. ruderalis]|uniref:Uncharacterized protein n=2 Tax=Marchantia polymorpha TaxID=3197 RepID=A0AAF6BIV2_MARPO|nr:hypothetical protein MARPO_0071s0003 [Marchantia polymorpha]BBN11936.1 hypothetical protein Mp_5g16070 [Marchantia polymorpha subsp. ruderalis]|eukprot:PTQ35384.1 hypothetical protein MARPO_0071s0003 [Marchantia polymorpha]
MHYVRRCQRIQRFPLFHDGCSVRDLVRQSFYPAGQSVALPSVGAVIRARPDWSTSSPAARGAPRRLAPGVLVHATGDLNWPAGLEAVPLLALGSALEAVGWERGFRWSFGRECDVRNVLNLRAYCHRIPSKNSVRNVVESGTRGV